MKTVSISETFTLFKCLGGVGKEKEMARKLSRRLKHTQHLIWGIPVGLVIILALAICVGHYVHTQKIKERERLTYQRQVQTAEQAKNLAYHSHKKEDIQSAKKLINKLQPKERHALNRGMAQLVTCIADIDKAKALINQEQQTVTEEGIKQAERQLKFLDKPEERDERLALSHQIKIAQKRLALQKKLKDKKLIALTFDDGPSPLTTPQLLKTLRQEAVPATFFALGSQAKCYPKLIKEENDLGNEVASHTWDHKNLVTLSPQDEKQEIESANHLINKLTGKQVSLFRPPYGSYNDTVLAQTNLSAVNWTVDTNDWRYRTSEPVVANALTYAHDGAIILMHDIHQWSVEAVPQIIQKLKAQGYTFVTVSTLLEVQDGGAKAHQVYFGR